MKTPANPSPKFWILTVLAAMLFSTAGVNSRRHINNSSEFSRPSSALLLPQIILWAWERPEKLNFIDPTRIGVAFLAKTVRLRGNEMVIRPRLQPMEVPHGTALIAVARIEVDHSTASLSTSQMKQTASEVSRLALLPDIKVVQVDFDATLSEREFYRELITELRQKLPASTALSITALASWCKGDNWLEGLPIAEAVPMLFRMGVQRGQILSSLAAGEGFAAKPCQQSAGISLDEQMVRLPALQRIYVFNPKSWSPSSVDQIMETYLHEQQAP